VARQIPAQAGTTNNAPDDLNISALHLLQGAIKMRAGWLKTASPAVADESIATYQHLYQ
jgi:hypothetical protein